MRLFLKCKVNVYTIILNGHIFLFYLPICFECHFLVVVFCVRVSSDDGRFLCNFIHGLVSIFYFPRLITKYVHIIVLFFSLFILLYSKFVIYFLCTPFSYGVWELVKGDSRHVVFEIHSLFDMVIFFRSKVESWCPFAKIRVEKLITIHPYVFIFSWLLVNYTSGI